MSYSDRQSSTTTTMHQRLGTHFSRKPHCRMQSKQSTSDLSQQLRSYWVQSGDVNIGGEDRVVVQKGE